MGRIKVDIGGLKELNRIIGRVVKEKEKEVDAVIEAGVQEMRRGAIQDAPADESTLRGGIVYKKEKPLQYQLFSNAYYSVYMEFGTKGRYQPIPGVDPSEFKATGIGKSGQGFYDSILEWVKRKGFAAEKTKSGKASKSLSSQIAQEQAAFAIYLSIIRHGVKPHPFFFKQEERVRPILIKDIQAVLND